MRRGWNWMGLLIQNTEGSTQNGIPVCEMKQFPRRFFVFPPFLPLPEKESSNNPDWWPDCLSLKSNMGLHILDRAWAKRWLIFSKEFAPPVSGSIICQSDLPQIKARSSEAYKKVIGQRMIRYEGNPWLTTLAIRGSWAIENGSLETRRFVTSVYISAIF